MCGRCVRVRVCVLRMRSVCACVHVRIRPPKAFGVLTDGAAVLMTVSAYAECARACVCACAGACVCVYVCKKMRVCIFSNAQPYTRTSKQVSFYYLLIVSLLSFSSQLPCAHQMILCT